MFDDIFDDSSTGSSSFTPPNECIRKRWSDLAGGCAPPKKTRTGRRNADQAVFLLVNSLERNAQHDEAKLVRDNSQEIIKWLDEIETAENLNDLDAFLDYQAAKKITRHIDDEQMRLWCKLGRYIALAAINTFDVAEFGKPRSEEILLELIRNKIVAKKEEVDSKIEAVRNRVFEKTIDQERKRKLNERQKVMEEFEQMREQEDDELSKRLEDLSIRRIGLRLKCSDEKARQIFTEEQQKQGLIEQFEEEIAPPRAPSPTRDDTLLSVTGIPMEYDTDEPTIDAAQNCYYDDSLACLGEESTSTNENEERSFSDTTSPVESSEKQDFSLEWDSINEMELRYSWCPRMRPFQLLLETTPKKSCLRSKPKWYIDPEVIDNDTTRLCWIGKKVTSKKLRFTEEEKWGVRIYTPTCDFDRNLAGWGRSGRMDFLNAADTGHTLWNDVAYTKFRELFSKHYLSIAPRKVMHADGKRLLYTYRSHNRAPDPYFTNGERVVRFLVDSNDVVRLNGREKFEEQRVEFFDNAQKFPRFYCNGIHKSRVMKKAKAKMLGESASHLIITDSALVNLNTLPSNAVLFAFEQQEFENWPKLYAEYNATNDPVFPEQVVVALGVDILKDIKTLFSPIVMESQNLREIVVDKPSCRKDFTDTFKIMRAAASNNKCGPLSESRMLLMIQKLLNEKLEVLHHERSKCVKMITDLVKRIIRFAFNIAYVLTYQQRIARERGFIPNTNPKDITIFITTLPEVGSLASYAKIFNTVLYDWFNDMCELDPAKYPMVKILDWGQQVDVARNELGCFNYNDHDSIDFLYQCFRDTLRSNPNCRLRFMWLALSCAEWQSVLRGDDYARQLKKRDPRIVDRLYQPTAERTKLMHKSFA